MTDTQVPVARHHEETSSLGRWIGQPVRRSEDQRLVRGLGRYVDDFDPARMVHLAIGRCPYPHARLLGIDASGALGVTGVLAVMTGAEVVRRTQPLSVMRPLPDVVRLPFYAMADEVAIFEGQPVVSVVAVSRAVAEDALERVVIDYEPLPHVVDVVAAMDDSSPVVWGVLGSNLIVQNTRDEGEPAARLDAADVVCTDRFRICRVTGLPMEGRAVLASFTPGLETLEVISSTQVPHMHRLQLSLALDMPEASIHLRAPDVGGGFGLKLGIYPEDVIACLHAMELGRPVKWVEDRMEHFRSTTHAREAVHDAAIGLSADGTITALTDSYMVDMGAYNSPFGSPMLSSLMFPGPYRISDCFVQRNVVITNKTPVGAYRGYGQPESNFVREVLLDRAARRAGVDPLEVRRLNMLRPSDFPYRNAGGATYDSGDYVGVLNIAAELIGYDELRQAERRLSDGRLRGVGLSSFVEMTGYPGSAFLGRHGAMYGAHESVTIRLNRAGGADLYTGVSSFGQATETSFAQITASLLGIAPTAVTVHAGDTRGTPYNVGSFASRTTIAGAGAIQAAVGDVRLKALRIAAHLIGAPVDELDIVDGVIRSTRSPELAIDLATVTAEAISGHHLPVGEEPGLESTRYFDPPANAFGYGTAAAVVALDEHTGEFTIDRFLLVHDCGRQVNPTIVEGQLHGGLAQGFGAAFFEEIIYDPDTGQMMNGTMLDYLMPTAADLPSFELAHADNPSPVTPLGVRGVGEAGTIPVAAAVANALCDATWPLPLEINRLPLTAETAWRALEDARARTGR